jgi:hypothetical protein
LAEVTCTPYIGLFKGSTVYKRALLALFVGVAHRWLRELAGNAASNRLTTPSKLLTLIYLSFTSIPGEALYIVRAVLLLTILSSPAERCVFMPFFNFINAALRPFLAQYFPEKLGLMSSLFAQLELQIQGQQLQYTDKMLRLAPFVNGILGEVPQLSCDVRRKAEWRRVVDAFIDLHPDVVLANVESFIDGANKENPIVYSYYQNLKFLLHQHAPNIPT